MSEHAIIGYSGENAWLLLDPEVKRGVRTVPLSYYWTLRYPASAYGVVEEKSEVAERIDSVLEEALEAAILTSDEKEALRDRLDAAASRACVAAMQAGAALMVTRSYEDLADTPGFTDGERDEPEAQDYQRSLTGAERARWSL